MSKERLVELLNAPTQAWEYLLCKANIEALADYLLARGVIVPPCKVGDVVYAITLNPKTVIHKIHRGVVTNIHCHTTGKHITVRHEGLDDEPYFDDLYCPFEIFGKTVFTSREEAEAKLKEKENET